MNNYISQIHGSASMDLIAKAKEYKEKDIDVIGLGGGEPDFDTPDIIKEKAISEIQRGNTHYAVGMGLPKLRERIAEKLYIDNNIEVSPEEIIVTPGAKMAIYLAVRACINVGDEVLIPTPSWVSYSEIVRAAGGVPVCIELFADNYYALSESVIFNKITDRTKVIILNSPNNPTGRVINGDEIEEIKRVVEKNDIVIISDEVYEKIIFDNRKFRSIAADPYLKDKTITINGFSKAYAMTGWRLGYLAGPEKYINIIKKLYTHTITGISPFLQEAAIVALGCYDEVERMRSEYEKRRNLFIAELNSITGIHAELPEGAFYAWARFDIENINSSQLATELLSKARVIGVPGIAYGDMNNNYIRFSFANKMEDLYEAVNRIREFML